MKNRFPRVASLRSPERLRERLDTLGVPLPCDDELLAERDSPLGVPLALGPGGRAPFAANRFVIQPMEGWDATPGGLPPS